MSNAPKPVTLKAGATTYTLKPGMNSICALEAEFNAGIFQVINLFSDATAMKVTDIRRFMVVVLRDEDGAKLSPELVAEVTESAGLKACSEAMGAYLSGAMADSQS